MIYTNGPDVINFLTRRSAFMIPMKVEKKSRKINNAYLYEMKEMMGKLKNNGGLLVYFYRITWRWYLPSKDELEKQLPPHLIKRYADGIIYEIKQ